MKGILNAMLLAALLFSQTPASAMQPTDEQTYYTNSALPFIATSLILGTGILGMVYYKCRQHESTYKQQEEARDYCVKCLQEAKRVTIKWKTLAAKDPHTPQIQKRALARISKLLNPITPFHGVALEKDKHYLVPYIDKLADACPADPMYTQKLSWFVRDAQTKELLPNRKTIACVLDLYNNLIDIVNEESAVPKTKSKR